MVVTAAVLAALVASAPTRATARGAASPLNDTEHECLELVPETVGASGVTDAGQKVSLDVVVLRDGITKARAKEVMARVADAYEPLDVDLVVRDVRKIRIPGEPPRPGGSTPAANDMRIFDAMISAMGGARPEGSDLVHLLTAKDVYYVNGGEPAYGLAGEAHCIGGVRYPEHAFSFSEGTGEYDEISEDMAGIIAAHELGHLMGAHHHYGNCNEGAPMTQGQRKTPCTVMWPFFITMNAGNFGNLEGATVRGHAVDFASP